MTPEQREELAACPFCGGTMQPFGKAQHNHPRNDCWLSSVKVETPEYESWNRRAQVEALTVPQWISVEDRLPDMEQPVYLFEKGRGIWTGARGDSGDAWLWGHCYGTEYFNSDDGTWEATQIEIDDHYQPTHWQPLPTIPAIPGTKEGA